MNNKRIIKKLQKAHSEYISVINSVEKHLEDKVKFPFEVRYNRSDLWVVLDTIEGAVLPIDSVLDVIKTKGEITREDLANIAI